MKTGRGSIFIWYYLGSLFVFFLIDRISKTVVYYRHQMSGSVPGQLPDFYLNQAAVFGLPVPTWALYIFTAIILLLLSVVSLLWLQQRAFVQLYFLCLIMLGGLSNLLDRWRWGGVIDYIAFGNVSVFNLADVYIVGSAIILFILLSLTHSTPYGHEGTIGDRHGADGGGNRS